VAVPPRALLFWIIERPGVDGGPPVYVLAPERTVVYPLPLFCVRPTLPASTLLADPLAVVKSLVLVSVRR